MSLTTILLIERHHQLRATGNGRNPQPPNPVVRKGPQNFSKCSLIAGFQQPILTARWLLFNGDQFLKRRILL